MNFIFTNTAAKRQATLRAIGQSAEPSKGLDWDGNKPLMRNRTAMSAIPDRYAARNILPFVALCFLTGCASYSKTGNWAPNGVNYTLSRDRQSGELTDYFGVSWQLK